MNILSREGLKTDFWKQNKSQLPKYDIKNMREATLKNTKWLHFGAGNIFRIFIAGLQEELLNQGIEQTGIVVAESFDSQIIEKIYKPYDNLTLGVTMKAKGDLQQQIIGSIAYSYSCNQKEKAAWSNLAEIAGMPQLQLISFTITEKGYKLTGDDGAFLPEVEQALKSGPGISDNIMVNAASLLYLRFKAGNLPVAMVSLDNCSSNGKVLFNSITEIARHWEDSGLTEKGFLAYVESPELVAFPWSMIDKITPRPSETVKEQLVQQGIDGLDIVCTDKHTYIAPFVNAEEIQYLVVEDSFPNGRPPLENAGVLFTDRQTVSKIETMKVTTCLNPLHTALAVFGCLLGYESISAEMKDTQLIGLIKQIGYNEALPVAVHPGIIDPKAFLDEVVTVRFPNPYIPDTPQRIATDTSQKMPIRFGQTIKAYESEGRDLSSLIGIPLVIAGWLRYLVCIDDEGNTFEPSPDPMLNPLRTIVNRASKDRTCLDEILSNEMIFNVDLVRVGMAETIKTLFYEMSSGKGAVRRTLQKYIEGELR